MSPHYTDDACTLYHGDCLDVLRELPDASVDAVVTDPPYGLEFMGKGWDAPWRDSDVNADAGMSDTGYTDGGERLPRPSFTGSTNPKCLRCKGTRRGRRDGTAQVPVCLCADGGRFPNVRAIEMRAFQEWCGVWAAECLRVLKPGGHLLAFGGSRTWHRLAAAVEDAGFEIRDSIAWLYGSGFPKSLDVSKAIDKAAGATREVVGRRMRLGDAKPYRNDGRATFSGFAENSDGDPLTAPATPDAERWQGWGTALKPAFEPIVVARKPLAAGTVAGNVLAHGTGALNIDACRVQMSAADRDRIDTMGGFGRKGWTRPDGTLGEVYEGTADGSLAPMDTTAHDAGRWPANVVLDDSQAAELDRQSGTRPSGIAVTRNGGGRKIFNQPSNGARVPDSGYGDTGGASRFFPTFHYEPKAPTAERPRVGGVAHPTVKPVDLMRWLVRLVTPAGGVVLDPFAGSGTTAEACAVEGLRCIAIEREADYLPLVVARMSKPIQLGLDLGV